MSQRFEQVENTSKYSSQRGYANNNTKNAQTWGTGSLSMHQNGHSRFPERAMAVRGCSLAATDRLVLLDQNW